MAWAMTGDLPQMASISPSDATVYIAPNVGQLPSSPAISATRSIAIGNDARANAHAAAITIASRIGPGSCSGDAPHDDHSRPTTGSGFHHGLLWP
jgi:hypothetical protein